MWKTIAQALGLNIPDDQLEALAPALDALWKGARQALDRDLSAVEPALKFYPEIGSQP